jgi:hypothetical protein
MVARQGRRKVRGGARPVPRESSAEAAIAEAAQRLGGVDRLVEWTLADSDNEAAFWKMLYPKLLTLQVSAELALSPEAEKWLGRTS